VIPEMKILFLNLDVGFFNPQKGQTAAERLISFRQAGQSREFFLLLFDIVAQLPNFFNRSCSEYFSKNYILTDIILPEDFMSTILYTDDSHQCIKFNSLAINGEVQANLFLIKHDRRGMIIGCGG